MTTSGRITADELLRLPDDGAHFYELVRGRLLVREPAGGRHGSIGQLAGIVLGEHVIAGRHGIVVGADTGFVIRRNPDTVRAPDAAFIRSARIPADGLPSNYIEGAPDIAVEVLSPGDTAVEMSAKVADYFAGGAQLVWVIHPKRRTLTIYAREREPVILAEHDTVDGGDVLPRFSCVVREMLDWPR